MRSRDIYLQKITDLKYFLSIFQGNIFYICIFCEYTINKNKLLEYVAISIKKTAFYFISDHILGKCI